MASEKSISASIKSIPAKKENLRKAFEVLQSYSSSFASFTIQWKDLESHFDSLEKSIDSKMKELEAKEKNVPKIMAKEKNVPKIMANESPATKQEEPESPLWADLKSLCLKKDAKGFRKYVTENWKKLSTVRDEVSLALGFAGDPVKLVLDAMEDFYSNGGKFDEVSPMIRRTCILLLEKLSTLSPEVKAPLKERAKKLALEWKGNITGGGQNPLEILGFLQLLATFDLLSAFDIDQVVDLIVDVSRRKQAIDLCRALIPAEQIPNLIQKLINKGKQIDAANLAYTFEVVGKFPPVPLLSAYLEESKKVAQEIRRKGNNSTASQHESIVKETSAMKAVIKFIEEHKIEKIESKFSRENLEKQIAELESKKPQKKRPAPQTSAVAAFKPQQQLANKRPRQALTSTNFSGSQRAHIVSPQQAAALRADRVPSYLGQGAAASYGLAGSTGSHYGHLSGGGHGLYGASPSLGLGMNQSPSRSHLYSSQSLGSMYDRPVAHSGYPSSSGVLPLPSQHRPSYYP